MIIPIQLSVGWGGGIEPPFQVNLWCSLGANTIETMDSIGWVESFIINILDCVDTKDTILSQRHFYSAPIGCRFESFRAHGLILGLLPLFSWYLGSVLVCFKIDPLFF